MDTSLSSIFDLYVFPTGRRLFALTQVMQRAKAAGHADLVKHCNAALVEDRKCLDLERRWGGAVAEAKGKVAPVADPNESPAAHKLDPIVDRTLVAIRDHAETQRAGAPEDDPIHLTVSKFLKTLFPTGVQDVTSLAFVLELAAVDDILAKLRSKELTPVVEELGLTRLVNRLADVNEQYRAALHAPEPETLAFGDVRAARVQGQERLLQTVAIVLGKHYKLTPEDIAAREDLLGPILEQNAAIAAAMRSRNVVQDVNPSTGEPDPTTSIPAPAPLNGTPA